MTTGVLVGNTTVLGKFSPKGLEAVASFWEYVGFVANSLIFLLIGVNLVAHHVFTVVSVACLTIILVILGRALAVYGSNIIASSMGGQGSTGVFLSTNNGIRWAAMNNGLANSRVMTICCRVEDRL